MLLFSAVYNFKMTFKMEAIIGEESYGFCYDRLHRKKNRLLFFVKVKFVFFYKFCSGNRFHQSMHQFPNHFWPDMIIP